MKRKSLIGSLIVLVLCLTACLSVFAACSTKFDTDTLEATLRSIELKNYQTYTTPTSYELERKVESYDSNQKAATIYIKWTIEDTSLITITEGRDTVMVNVLQPRAANIYYKLRATLTDAKGKAYLRGDGTRYTIALTRLAPGPGYSDSQGDGQQGGGGQQGDGQQSGITTGTFTVVMAEQGFDDRQPVTKSITSNGVTIAVSKGTGTSDPAYYTNTEGNALRLYGDNTMTLTANGATIKSVVFNFASAGGTKEMTANVGTFATDTWTGSASSITFTMESGGGNRWIVSMTITLG